MNQTRRLASRPDTRIDFAVFVHLLAALTRHERANVSELRALLLLLDHLQRDLVLVDTRRVAQAAHNVYRVALRRLDQVRLDLVVDFTFPGRHETRAHVGTTGPQRKRSRQAAAIGHATRCDERNRRLFGGEGQEHQTTNVVLTRVSRTLEAINTQHIRTELRSLKSMADRRALVYHESARLLEHLDHRLRVAAGCLKDPDTGFQCRTCISLIVRGHNGRQECNVHTKGTVLRALLGNLRVNQRASLFNRRTQRLRRRLRQSRQHAQSPGIRDRSSQGWLADPLHTTHHKGHTQLERIR